MIQIAAALFKALNPCVILGTESISVIEYVSSLAVQTLQGNLKYTEVSFNLGVNLLFRHVKNLIREEKL